MTKDEAIAAIRALLDEHRKKYVPDERATQSKGQLGFDYGYHQALAEIDASLYRAFEKANGE